MAQPGDVIEAPSAGLKMIFHQTDVSSNGHTLQFEYIQQPGKGFDRPHLHVGQVEHYELLSGEAMYAQNGVEKIARAGDVITNLPAQPHINPWNRDGKEPLHLLITAHPSLGVEYYFEMWFGMVNAGRHLTSSGEAMNLFQNMVTVSGLPADTLAAGPPIPLQRIGLLGVIAIGRLRGYQPFYADIVDVAAAMQTNNNVKALRPEDLSYTPYGAPPAL